MKRKRLIPIILAGALLLGIVLYLLLRPGHFTYIGTIEATKVDLSSRVSSVIATYEIKEGNSVKAGDTLVRLACEDIRIAAETAIRDFERGQRLFRSGTLPQENFDHLKTRRDDAVLKQDWCTIRSPLNGKVLETYREPSEWVTPGTKLLTLADLSEVWAMIYVPAPTLGQLALERPVRASTDGFKTVMNGKITHISDEAEFTPKNVQTREERTRLVFGVKVRFANPQGLLKPGMSIEVEL